MVGLDLIIEPGERVLLLGASGAGKSTLLAGLAGLLADQASGETSGTLELDGVDAAAARHRAGLLLQDPDTQLVMGRVGDDVAFGPENHAVPEAGIWPRVAETLALVEFPYDLHHLTSALSGGEKQRLALAGVLAMRPGLLLLDEPTAHLDPAAASAMVAGVGRVLDRTGATLLVVEHRVDLWAPLVDRVVVLAAGGGVLADGRPAAVFTVLAERLRAAGVWLPGMTVAKCPAVAGPGDVVVRADGVGLTYRGAPGPALWPTSMVVRTGQAVAVTGASGSGKSTLARLLAGLDRPTAGAVRADGPQPLHTWRARALAGLVGTVFQQPEHQFVTRTVRAELLLGPQRLGWPAARTAARVDELLARLRLTRLAAANPFTLSGGEKRRLSVATALSAAPALLVLDEPTFGQDAATWTQLLELLVQVRAAGTGIVLVSHDTTLVDAVADVRHVMAGGRLA